jgi:hypothetical protein
MHFDAMCLHVIVAESFVPIGNAVLNSETETSAPPRWKHASLPRPPMINVVWVTFKHGLHWHSRVRANERCGEDGRTSSEVLT